MSSITAGVSIENASYMDTNNESLSTNDSIMESRNHKDEEHTPQLFSRENESLNENDFDESNETHSEKLFDQDINDEEDFEIPAFLRKQKF